MSNRSPDGARFDGPKLVRPIVHAIHEKPGNLLVCGQLAERSGGCPAVRSWSPVLAARNELRICAGTGGRGLLDKDMSIEILPSLVPKSEMRRVVLPPSAEEARGHEAWDQRRLREHSLRVVSLVKAEPGDEACRSDADREYAEPSVLLQSVLAVENVRRAWDKVRGNGGAPGCDRQTIAELAPRFEKAWAETRERILKGVYRTKPVRQVKVPKADGGVRVLGIPTVMDRVVQQAVAQTLAPLWEPHFSPHSYAYRPGRGAHDAVAAVQRALNAGGVWAADLDIERFFDSIDHGLLLKRLESRGCPGDVRELMAGFLRAGAIFGGRREATQSGTPQGSPLSPLLANVVLDELDRTLTERGASFARYADDVLILAPTEADASRRRIEAEEMLADLGLRLNAAKTRVQSAERVEFLGFSFARGEQGWMRCIAPGAMAAARDEVTAIVRQGDAQDWRGIARDVGAYLAGWSVYFSYAERPWDISLVKSHARVQLRAALWRQWGSAARRERELVARGVHPQQARQLAESPIREEEAGRSPLLGQVLPNSVFAPFGLAPAPAPWKAAGGAYFQVPRVTSSGESGSTKGTTKGTVPAAGAPEQRAGTAQPATAAPEKPKGRGGWRIGLSLAVGGFRAELGFAIHRDAPGSGKSGAEVGA